MRYLNYSSYPLSELCIPSSIYRLCNLQTIILRTVEAFAPPEIWMMPFLRHVEFATIHLPGPPNGNGNTKANFVLGNLQTLSSVKLLEFVEEVVERIPNIKKLKIYHGQYDGESLHNLNNLGHLSELQSLNCFILSRISTGLLQNLTFPHTLKRMTLRGTNLHWEDMSEKIGSLPRLEVLKLHMCSFTGPEWETFEGQFCKLKFLLIVGCDLRYWKTENSHFPCLQLRYLRELEEIPSDIGEIPTLQLIKLVACSISANISAEQILKEQEEVGNEGLRVEVVVDEYEKMLECLDILKSYTLKFGKN